jgi:hypothetical protein
VFLYRGFCRMNRSLSNRTEGKGSKEQDKEMKPHETVPKRIKSGGEQRPMYPPSAGVLLGCWLQGPGEASTQDYRDHRL